MITTESFLADNYSAQATAKIEAWIKTRDAGQLFVVGACSDARLILPDLAYHIRTISATGPRSPWHDAFNYDKVQGALILGHFDCGGLKVKKAISGKEVSDESAMGYVRDHVWREEPVIQVLATASWTASRTHKRVLAVVQDHHDGALYIQGSFNDADQTEYKTVPFYVMSRYIKEDIYKNGRPQLNPLLVAPVFKPCLEAIQAKAAVLMEKYPDFKQRQEIQNMEVVGLTNNLKPLSVRFPGLFGEPNTIFQVSLKRQFVEETEHADDAIADAFRQVHYPLLECVENQEKPNSAFRDTRVLYIETEKMEFSDRLAKQAMRKQWVRNWLELPGREVIISEVAFGRIQKIDRAA